MDLVEQYAEGLSPGFDLHVLYLFQHVPQRDARRLEAGEASGFEFLGASQNCGKELDAVRQRLADLGNPALAERVEILARMFRALLLLTYAEVHFRPEGLGARRCQQRFERMVCCLVPDPHSTPPVGGR